MSELESNCERYFESLVEKGTLDGVCPCSDLCSREKTERCEENNYFACKNYYYILQLWEKGGYSPQDIRTLQDESQ